MPTDAASQTAWAKSAAVILAEVANLDAIGRKKLVEAGRLNAARFDAESALTAYEKIYKRALAQSKESRNQRAVAGRPNQALPIHMPGTMAPSEILNGESRGLK
jgi:hypothetical protein